MRLGCVTIKLHSVVQSVLLAKLAKAAPVQPPMQLVVDMAHAMVMARAQGLANANARRGSRARTAINAATK